MVFSDYLRRRLTSPRQPRARKPRDVASGITLTPLSLIFWIAAASRASFQMDTSSIFPLKRKLFPVSAPPPMWRASDSGPFGESAKSISVRWSDGEMTSAQVTRDAMTMSRGH